MQNIGTALDVGSVPRVAARGRTWVLSGVALGTFMTSVDGSSITTILPVIGRSFGSPIESLEWVVTANLLVVSALLLAAGWVADARGHGRVYVVGIVVFVMASMLCALAPSTAALVGARALQAAGSAMILATSATLLMRIYPGAERGWALGLHVAANYVGLAIGPWLSGWLTDSYGWRAAFLVHLPLGMAACVLSARSLVGAAVVRRAGRFDAAGSILFAGGLAAFLVALNQLRSHPVSATGIALFATSMLAFLAFTAVESRRQHALLDLRLFTLPPFGIAVISLVFAYVCLQSVTFALPFYLIHARGLTTRAAGLLMSLRPALTALVAPLGGRICDRAGPALIGGLGIGLLCVGALFIARVDAQASLAHISAGLMLMAIGMGLFLAPAHSSLLGAVNVPRQGVAVGVMHTARTVGMAVGVGVGRSLILESSHAAMLR